MALRTPLTVQPHLYIGDPTGRPLDYGIIYFGEPNKDPEFYPIKIYLDPEMTIETAQPVRTQNGFVTFGGDLTELHAEEVIYSIKVLDKDRRQIFYKPEMYRNNVSDFLQDEILRATEAEQVLTNNISSEVTRATNAETVIAGNLNTEITRATNAEQLIDTKFTEANTLLDGKITSVAGGKKAYLTYALMTADAANIPANSSVDVLADTDSTKNGMYAYNGTVFAKSAYDPLTQAKSYTDLAIPAVTYQLGQGNILHPDEIYLFSNRGLDASNTIIVANNFVLGIAAVESGKTLYVSNSVNSFSRFQAGAYAFYSDNPISNSSATLVAATMTSVTDADTGKLYAYGTIPTAAKYIVITTKTSTVPNVDWTGHFDSLSFDFAKPPKLLESVGGYNLPDTVTNTSSGISRFSGKSLLVTGDSITDSNNSHTTKWWHEYVKDYFDFGTLQNDGKSGTGLVKESNGVVGIVDRVPTWTATYTKPDCILVMGNMNDGSLGAYSDWNWIYGANDINKGDFTTVVNDTNKKDSLWFALRYLFERLIADYPVASIGYILSTPRGVDSIKSGTVRTGYTLKNWGSNGWFSEWADVTKEVASHYSIPVLDLYHKSNFRPWTDAGATAMFSDATHPNTAGHKKMSSVIIPFVAQFM